MHCTALHCIALHCTALHWWLGLWEEEGREKKEEEEH